MMLKVVKATLSFNMSNQILLFLLISDFEALTHTALHHKILLLLLHVEMEPMLGMIIIQLIDYASLKILLAGKETHLLDSFHVTKKSKHKAIDFRDLQVDVIGIKDNFCFSF